MKGWQALLALTIAVIAVGVVALKKASHPIDMPTEEYASGAEAQARHAFAPVPQGWLPALIPMGATRIRSAHNPPTHQTWGEFQAPLDGWAPAGADKEQPTELMLLGAPAVVPWWPDFLRGRVASSSLQQRGFRLYFLSSVEASPLVVAVSGRQVYWWRLARQ